MHFQNFLLATGLFAGLALSSTPSSGIPSSSTSPTQTGGSKPTGTISLHRDDDKWSFEVVNVSGCGSDRAAKSDVFAEGKDDEIQVPKSARVSHDKFGEVAQAKICGTAMLMISIPKEGSHEDVTVVFSNKVQKRVCKVPFPLQDGSSCEPELKDI